MISRRPLGPLHSGAALDTFTAMPHTAVIFGRDVQESVGALVKRFGGSRVLVHYGRQNVTDPGLLDQIRHSFEEHGIEHTELGGVLKNSRLSTVEEGIKACRSFEADFVLAVGGGSVVNSAKAVAAGALWDGDLRHLFESGAEPLALPLGVIVTVPGSGDELSGSCTVSEARSDGGRGVRLYDLHSEFLYPKFAVCNPALVTSFPKHLGISFVNIFVKLAEDYFTSTRCGELSDAICEGSLRVTVEMLQRLRQDPHDYDALSNLMWSGVLAYSEYALGAKQNQALERLEHAVTTVLDCAHGKSVGLLFPAWLEFVMPANAGRIARFAQKVFGLPHDGSDALAVAQEGLAKIRTLFKSLGMPSTFEELGGQSGDLRLIMEALNLGPEETIGNFTPLNRIDCEALLSLILISKAEHPSGLA